MWVGVGGLAEFDAEFKFAKIQNSHHEGGGLIEFDAEFKFAKIQNSHYEGGGGLTEFDTEFKFAKIQNSHYEGGGGGLQNLTLSSNLLKSKIPMLDGGGGRSWNLMLSPNLLKKKSFRAKMCLGMVLDFEYQVVRIYEVYANHN